MIFEIWEKLLGIEKIGVRDDFFTPGGDSVLGIQVISRLRECLSCRYVAGDVVRASNYCGTLERAYRTVGPERRR
jgi:Phosphopantetheine attachment site